MQLSTSDVARLAVLLDRARYSDLAQRIGRAIDANWRQVPLTSRDRTPILEVLEADAPGPLAELRDVLLEDGDRATGTKLQ